MDISLFKDLGLAGVILYVAYLVVSKLYTDMRIDSTKREERLMGHMDKQGEAMKEQSVAMKEIATTLKTMDGRICSLEMKVDCNGKDGDKE